MTGNFLAYQNWLDVRPDVKTQLKTLRFTYGGFAIWQQAATSLKLEDQINVAYLVKDGQPLSLALSYGRKAGVYTHQQFRRLGFGKKVLACLNSHAKKPLTFFPHDDQSGKFFASGGIHQRHLNWYGL